MNAPPLPDSQLIVSTEAGYDRWAEIYDTDGNPLVALEEPQVKRLLGEVSGLTIADIGCGTGRHAAWLVQAGARVTAIDFSEGMLAKACEKPGAAAVRFIRHDLTTSLPFAKAEFERAICCLVLDHVSDLKTLFAEMHRILRPGGWLVVSIMHPAMMLRGVQARFKDPKTGQETRPQSFPNNISDYVMAAAAADFSFASLSEHAVTEELVRITPRAERYLGWPMLFMMKLLRSHS